MPVPKIAVTGGPCGGKTTALPYITQKLSDRGWTPLIIPESPTLLMQGNLTPVFGVFSNKTFQRSVIETVLNLEHTFGNAARECNGKPIIVCDRGIPDCRDYSPNGEYEEILKGLSLGTHTEVRDGRYGAVFHLRSAAVGAEEFYSLATNSVRRETPAEARERDEQTLRSWMGHPHLRVIDNSTDFAGKLKRLDRHICSFLGIPVPLEIERKYLCQPTVELPVPHQSVHIEQVYLLSPDENTEIRVRRRGADGSYVYFRTEKRSVRPGVRVETESFIDEREYLMSIRFQLPNTRVIKKMRTCFLYNEQYFELDCIDTRNGTIFLLEIELTEENDAVILPPFIKVIKEVTGDEQFSNRWLAKIF